MAFDSAQWKAVRPALDSSGSEFDSDSDSNSPACGSARPSPDSFAGADCFQLSTKPRRGAQFLIYY